jgi:transcriptional regulator GlxA family with amidase domain
MPFEAAIRAVSHFKKRHSVTESIHDVARCCGFGNPERMRRTFLRLYGAPPSAIKYQGR